MDINTRKVQSDVCSDRAHEFAGSRNWFASGISVSKLREVQMCVVCWLELDGGKAALHRAGGR